MKFCYFFILFTIIGSAQLSLASSNMGRANQSLINVIEEKINHYYRQHNKYPSTSEGLREVSKKTSPKKEPFVPTDRWGNSIIYIYPAVYGNKAFDLYSCGKNGVDDFGKLDDITNWTAISERHYYPVKWMFNELILIIILTAMLLIWVRFKKLKKKSPGDH